MALNFPDNPTPGQQYTDPNNLIWEFNGVVWTPITGAVGISGFSGTSGYSGYSGTSGYSGITGISGFSGTGSAISASDEGNLLTNTVSSFNFVGTNVVATNVGGAVTLTIDPPIVYNNSAWSWGQNKFFSTPSGKLGDNTTVDKSSPVSVVGGFTDWCQISAGKAFVGHSVAVRTNGTAWAWGAASVGQLGDGTTANKSSPVSVVGGYTDWCQVSAGADHSLGLRTNGTAWAWGYGGTGKLGDNTVANKSSPVSVVGGFTDWSQVSAGYIHSLGLRTNGTAWGWGQGSNGKLGDNTTVDKSSPVSVVGGFTDWCQVSAGKRHSVAVRTNGTAWAWGCNTCGILGDNTTANKSSPVSVVGGFTDWCQVSAGGSYHSVAVRQNSTIWSWGRNYRGELGDNTGTARSSPVSVVGGFTDWCQVSAGTSAHSVAVRTNGTAWSWGAGFYGAIGDNTTVSKSSPVSVIGGFTDWCQVSAGNYFSLAIRSTIT
jgi:alpha-tubulin suppressor-like RCC1 family protein